MAFASWPLAAVLPKAFLCWSWTTARWSPIKRSSILCLATICSASSCTTARWLRALLYDGCGWVSSEFFVRLVWNNFVFYIFQRTICQTSRYMHTLRLWLRHQSRVDNDRAIVAAVRYCESQRSVWRGKSFAEVATIDCTRHPTALRIFWTTDLEWIYMYIRI